MEGIFVQTAVAGLGFVLGYFYTRTMKLAVYLPERYVNKDDCASARHDCGHGRDVGREEVMGRFDRLEAKVDRLAEMLLGGRV